jgi:hypothetical protein
VVALKSGDGGVKMTTQDVKYLNDKVVELEEKYQNLLTFLFNKGVIESQKEMNCAIYGTPLKR